MGAFAGKVPRAVPGTLLAGVVSLVEMGGREYVSGRVLCACGWLLEPGSLLAGRNSAASGLRAVMSERLPMRVVRSGAAARAGVGDELIAGLPAAGLDTAALGGEPIDAPP
ncbi:MAG: hypothetical protein PHO37_08415 [Kiritimatiellae bacterium]|nr:hypothetical protein [Kiritimatiellia bacterium]